MWESKLRAKQRSSVLNHAVNIQPSHYTNASFHSRSFCSREGGREKSVLFQVKTTKSFNCVMKKKSEQKGRVVRELIRQQSTQLIVRESSAGTEGYLELLY